MKAVRKYGVISEPEISCRYIAFEGNFIVMGSDGLFDALNKSDIINFVAKHQHENREDLCEMLANEAREKSFSDSEDISVIIIFL